MKTLVSAFLACGVLIFSARAEAPAVTERGPHTCLWTAPHSAGGGRIVQIETGLNYWDPAAQQWRLSDPVFELGSDRQSYVAERVQHKLRISAQINCVGAVHVALDDLVLDSTPVAIAIYDPASGAFAILAGITNSTGVPMDDRKDQLLFPDAFNANGVCASLVYTIERGTFSQDIVFTGKFDPAAYGFSSNCWIQIITEFYGDVPQPDRMRVPLYIERDPALRQSMASPDLVDEMLGFGNLVLDTGHAYAMPTPGAPNGSRAIVAKAFRGANGRVFLTESLPFAPLAQQFLSLPECTSGGQARLNRAGSGKVDYAAIPRPPAAAAQAQAAPAGKRLAQLSQASSGGPSFSRLSNTPSVWADYVLNIGGSMSGTIVFQSCSNYFVSGPVFCNGPTTIEPTVFKYQTNASIKLNNILTCKTSQFRPAVFTALDDNTIGDSLAGMTNYTGVINTSGYANPALYMGMNTFTLSLTNFRFCYAQKAIRCEGMGGTTANLVLNHSQIINCIKGIELGWNAGGYAGASGPAKVTLNNTLIAGAQYPLYLDNTPSLMPITLNLLHCTVDGGQQFIGGSCSWQAIPYINSTNCIYANLTSLMSTNPSGTFSGATNAFYAAPQFPSSGGYLLLSSSPFQTVGHGNYYLTDASGCRNRGATSGVPASLVGDLKKRTTYPPVVTAAATLNTDQLLSPQAQRDTGQRQSLGFHYDPIDAAFGWVMVTNATVTLTNGAVMGAFGTNAGSYGLAIGQGAVFQSQGTPNSLNWVVAYNAVQEQPTNGWVRPANGLLLSEFQGLNPAATINCRFTAWSVPSLDEPAFSAPTNTGPFNFRDCEFHGGKLLSAGPTLNLTNCLLERVYADVQPKDGATSYVRNCLVLGGSFGFGPTNSLVADNLFDTPIIPDWIGGRGNTYSGGFNAYVTNYNRLQPAKASDIILSASPSYRAGPLGSYYQLTNSALVNAGSTWASNVMLFHYTVTTNLVKEGGTTVDLSYHYVATDTNGIPIDSDGDGFPDALEDTNGNGACDAGDLSDWQIYDSPNGLTTGNGLRVFTPLK